MASARPTPPIPTPTTPPRLLDGSEWFLARATLALRRSLRFVKFWVPIVGGLALLALLVPLATSDPAAPARARLQRQAADTLRSAGRLRTAEFAVAAAESALVAARNVATTPAPRDVARPAPVVAAPVVRSIEPSVAEFERLITEARQLRTPPSWLAVAAHPAVNSGPRMRSLADTLAGLVAQQEALGSGPQREQQIDEIARRISRTGYTIIAIAENKRDELIAAGTTTVAPAPAVTTPVLTPIAPRARTAAVKPDTARVFATLLAARDTLAQIRRQHDSLRTIVTALAGEAIMPSKSSLAAATPAIALFVLLFAGLAIRLGGALSHEMRAPTVAHAAEATAVFGSPVLATVRDALLDGPARFRPSGVDPFRMLYLGLTATGTRARTAIVTGSDPTIAAAAAARLAIAAAADHRTTLAIDLDPSEIALARTFRERPEPGFTDALAGAFRWKDVARPVGSSDGLPITLMPAGTERDDVSPATTMETLREEFTKFRTQFELTIVVCPLDRVGTALALLPASPVIHTAVAGETPVDRLMEEGSAVRAQDRRVQGLVLWDAPRPELPTRAELAALLSKRKGRTPGGSFEAVRRAIREPN